MKVNLIKIGNSQGVRIPKALIDQCGLRREVELEVKGNTLLLRSSPPSRSGWDEAFSKRVERHVTDSLLPDHMSQGWDEAEWTW